MNTLPINRIFNGTDLQWDELCNQLATLGFLKEDFVNADFLCCKKFSQKHVTVSFESKSLKLNFPNFFIVGMHAAGCQSLPRTRFEPSSFATRYSIPLHHTVVDLIRERYTHLIFHHNSNLLKLSFMVLFICNKHLIKLRMNI